MKTTTLSDLNEMLIVINNYFGFDKFKLSQRNGFVYFDYSDNSKESLFNSALTKRTLLNEMRAFYNGLTFNK